MEALGVISKVKDPTLWRAGMVVVPKKTGAVRIRVDLKPLNESVLWEVHPISRVDEALAQLAGVAIFSKLDANSGFWHFPLSPESRPLTILIHYATWEISFQQTTLWHLQFSRVISKENECNP